MEAVILAGGLGTRLRAVVHDVPKPMAPIAGHPFLEILLTQLSRQNFDRVILSVGHLADRVVDHFGERFLNLELHYIIEETPLGTGGALAAALPHCRSDHAFVLNGDTFLDLEMGAVEQMWQARRSPIMVLREVGDTARYGRVELDGELITGFSEKGISGRGSINAGTYVLPVELLDAWVDRAPFSFEADFLPAAIKDLSLLGFCSAGAFIDIGIPEDYQRAQTLLLPWLS